MRYRCQNPNNKSYERYGARGITVCERWAKFENFYADMGPRPSGRSLERKKNNDGYSPENCVWGTPSDQQRNKRTSKLTIDLAEEVLGRIEHGEARVSVARRMKLSCSYVSELWSGKYWFLLLINIFPW